MDFGRCWFSYRFYIKIFRMKNIISNIIGFLIIGVSVYGLLFLELELLKFAVLSAMGFAAFYFENSTIKKYIKKAFDKWLK